jgi:hypothetical protein
MNNITALDPIPGIQTDRQLHLQELEHKRGDAQGTSKTAL